MPAYPSSDKSELPNLDLLRALAVLLVVADHVLETIGHLNSQSFHPYDWYMGRLGVLLFFVHTSLVLMWSMHRLRTWGWVLLKTFYIRRAFRIYPLSVVCVLTVVWLGVPVLPWETFSPPSAGALVSNVLLTMNLTDSERVLTPLWSLPIEVQMYVALPFVYMFIGSSSSTTRAIGLYAGGVVAGSVLPMLSSKLSMFLFAPCFMGGVVAYCRQQRAEALYPAWLWIVVLIAVSGMYILIEDMTPGIHHNLLQWLTCLAIGLLIPLFKQSRLAVMNVPAHYVAKYSYGIYLFHCVALWLACFRLELADITRWLIVVVVLIALTVLGFHLLEQPGIRLGAKLARRGNMAGWYGASVVSPDRRTTSVYGHDVKHEVGSVGNTQPAESGGIARVVAD